MASSPITPWQTHGGEMEIVTDFIFLSSKITVDSDCSHEIKRHLLLERKAMTNLNSVLKKQKHHFVVKGSSSQSCGFSSSHVWMWELGIKKTECPRIDALELWCWRRLLRVPWTARRWNQSIHIRWPGIPISLRTFHSLLWATQSMEKGKILPTWIRVPKNSEEK